MRRPASAPHTRPVSAASSGVGADALRERGEQAGEQRVRGRVETERGRARREEIEVLGPPDGAAVHRLDVDEAGLPEALEVEAHGVGVEPEPLGEILRRERGGGAGELAVHRVPRLVAERLEHCELVRLSRPSCLTVARPGHIFKV